MNTPYHHFNYCVAVITLLTRFEFILVNCLRYGTFSEYFLLEEATFQHAYRLYLPRFSKNFQMLQFCFRGLSVVTWCFLIRACYCFLIRDSVDR